MRLLFGTDGIGWDEEKVLERYECLYEAGLMGEENTRVRNQFDMPLVYLDTEQYLDFIRRRAEWDAAADLLRTLAMD